MGSFSTSKQVVPQHESDVCEEPLAPSPATSNSAAIDRMTRTGGGSAPPNDVKLGEVQDGPSFGRAGAAALNAVVPGPGSFASLKISGKIPIYTTPAFSAFLESVLQVQAARTKSGTFEATFSSQLGVLAEAGASGSPWWPRFVATLKAYVKGSLKIVGDDAEEIFDQFLLTLSHVVANAATAAGAEPATVNDMSGALVGGRAAAIARLMDKDDGVTVSLGGGVEAGANTPFGSASVGGEVSFSRTLGNTDGDTDLEVSDTTSLTIAGQFTHGKLGPTVPANVTFVEKEGKLDEWFVGVGVAKKLPLGVVSKEVLLGAAWAEGLVNAMSNLVATTASKAKLDSAAVADLVSGISVGGDALAYTALGDQLKAAATHPAFDGKSGQEVSLAVDGQAGWSADKGANVRAGVSTAETWTLGEEGKTPLFIEARSGDSIVSFEAGEKTGASVGT